MRSDQLNQHTVVEFLFDLFTRRGAEEYMGEKVSMAEHMEQSAACAVADGASDALVVASLLHDIGHFVGDFPIDALENGVDNLHEEVGASFLDRYFPASVTEPIRLHVAAKKYLCAVDETYIERLSPASVNSLRVQGGPMTRSDIDEFESNPHHHAAVKLRLYDDEGKVAGLDITPLTEYRSRLESLLLSAPLVAGAVTARIERFSYDASELRLDWSDGRQSRLAAVWLRDHCQMRASRDPVSGQRLLNITDIPTDIHICSVSLSESSLVIDFAPDSHRSEFSVDWLRRNCYCRNIQTDDRSEASKHLWQGNSFERGLPRYRYDEFCRSSTTKIAALQSVKNNGFVLLHGVPCEPGEVLKVIAQFGFVRDTNYGPLFDVRSEVNANNLAFTNLGLGCHLDNPYRDPVPGVQLIHCLQSSTEGGESVLQDGFSAADILRRENSQHFDVLSRHWINYRFQDAGTDLQSRVPMIEVNDLGQVVKVRYNNRSIAPLRLEPGTVTAFYAAYRHFAEILERHALQLTFKLEPGELMMFDNTRVLHARKAFSKGGMRHLQGAYSDLDGLYSTLSVLKSQGAHSS